MKKLFLVRKYYASVYILSQIEVLLLEGLYKLYEKYKSRTKV